MPWTPILEGAEADRAQRRIESIAHEALARWKQWPAKMNLLEGRIGLAFAFQEWARAGIRGAAEAVDPVVSEAVDLFNTHGAKSGLHNGLAGLGWLLHDWGGVDELVRTIDDALLTQVQSDTGSPPLVSLRAGLAGFGLYAAHRGEQLAAQRLGQLVRSRLREAAVPTPQGLSWRTPVSYARARGLQVADGSVICEWGVAHGVTPVLLCLAQWGMDADLVHGGLRWLWNSTSPQANRFGCQVVDGVKTQDLVPMSWCTGDVGVGLLAWLAAQPSQDTWSSKLALDLGLSLADRVVGGERPGHPGHVDLCCGVSGALHVFTRWFHATGEARFADASRCLAARVLDELDAGVTAPHNLQFGLEGVALALLALLQPAEPRWDALFGFTWPTQAPT